MPVDAALCPLCAKTNLCAMEVEKTTGTAQPDCWCKSVTFDAQLLSRIPAEARGFACVCQACAAALEPA
jgi:hypothetical protein